ncbi:MAG: lysozyme family protein, partial [Streptococcus salivarius]
MFKWIRRLAVFVVVLIIVIQCYRIHANIQHVLTYESMVKEVLAEDDIDNTTNVDLVLAMIYTETKGKTDDVMQSSESSTGVTNSITDRKESIRQGVTVLSENLEEAAHHKVDPWTAVQAYNFGKAYIDYVADNGGVNTVELAKAYSKNVVAPSLGNISGETYTYYQPVAMYYGGGKLYTNGGNI